MQNTSAWFLLCLVSAGVGLASGGPVQLHNAEQHFDAVFDGDGVTIDRAGQRLTMSLEGWGGVSAVSHREDRVELQRGGLLEWYENSAKGLEQGFTVKQKRGDLVLRLRVTGDYAAGSDVGGLVLRPVGGSGRPLRYGELTAWDADGKVLESRMETRDGEIRLYVNDVGARYPVTIDPIVNEPPVPVSNLVAGDHFGAAIAVSGDTALVGAPDQNSGDGIVYVYVRANGVWVEQQQLKPIPGTKGQFGKSVAISGDMAIVGAPKEPFLGGAAYIYSRNGNRWTQRDRLLEPTGNRSGEEFGASVGIDGTTVIIGATDYYSAGGAFIFELDVSGRWFGHSIWSRSGYGRFGHSVSVSGGQAVVSATDAVAFGTRQSRGTWTWAVQNLPGAGSIQSVSINAQVAVVGAPAQNLVYIFKPSPTQPWTQLGTVAGPNSGGGGFGSSVAQVGSVVVVGAAGAISGSAYAFTWNGSAGPLVELPASSARDGGYGKAIAVGANHVLVGSPNWSAGKGAVESFQMQNVVIQSNPPGQPFQVSGPGCGDNISPAALMSPFAGYFTDCTVTWAPSSIPPQAGRRYSFQTWADGVLQNTRSIKESPDPTRAAVTYTGNMLTEYELTTQASPVSGGSVQGAGWFAAGTSARLVAVPNPGFQFAGFTGGHLKTQLNPAAITMNAPTAVTGIFSTTPPASITAMLMPPTGPLHARNWTISVLNEGPGVAYDTNLVLLGFRQTAGAPCVVLPMRLNPVMFPVYVGVMPVRGMANISTTLDFTGCPPDALFTVTMVLAANGGSSGGVVRLMNQVQ